MMTLRKFSAEPSTIPTITSWYIADLNRAQGKQEGEPLLKNRGPVAIWQKKGLMHDLLTGKVRIRL